jgi:hypothetical protein
MLIMSVEPDEKQLHIRELRSSLIKRLRVLELKEARQGLETPPSVITEIDAIKRRIAKLDQSLQSALILAEITITKNIRKEINDNAKLALHKARRRIDVVFQGDFSDITPEIKEATIRAIAAIVGIKQEEVRFIDSPHENVTRIELPENAAEKLVSLQKSGDKNLREIGVAWIRILDSSNWRRRYSDGINDDIIREPEIFDGIDIWLLRGIELTILTHLFITLLFSRKHIIILSTVIATFVIMRNINSLPVGSENVNVRYTRITRLIWMIIVSLICFVVISFTLVTEWP